MKWIRKIRSYIYTCIHRREIAENIRLTFHLARQDILIEDQHRYIHHLREEMKKLFKASPMKVRPEASTKNITQIGREILELRFNEQWNMIVPHDFEDLAPDIRLEWAKATAQNAVNDLENKLAQEIYKQINT